MGKEGQTIEIADGIEPIRLAPGMLPVAPLLATLGRFERPKLERFIATAIELLDLFDGDAEAEDGNDLEDDFTLTRNAKGYAEGPGCPIGDSRGDLAWVEWDQMRGSKKGGPNIIGNYFEDDEEDDPAEDDDPAGGLADEDQPGGYLHYVPTGAGCEISDPGGCQHDGREPDDGR